MMMLRRSSYQQDIILLILIIIFAYVLYQETGGLYPRRRRKHIQFRDEELPYDPKRKKLNFQSFATCKLKPKFIKEYKANCFYVCRYDGLYQACRPDKDKVDRTHKACLSNYHFIGVQQSGEDQVRQWFEQARNEELVISKANMWPSGTCPDAEIAYTGLFNADGPKIIARNQVSLNIGAHNLLANKRMEDSPIRLSVQTVVQILSYMGTPQSRYHIQLRHPTDRLIDQMIAWRRAGLIYTHIPEVEFSGETLNQIVHERIREFKTCLKTFNELVCFYSSEGREGDQKALIRQSIYVLLMETAFKFIPRPQILITRTPYTKDEARETMKKTFAFFNQTIPPNLQDITLPAAEQINSYLVLNKTIQTLDEFFAPYNKRLVHLLRSEQWLFQRSEKT